MGNQILNDNAPVIKMNLEKRKCDCCNSNDLELVWSNQSYVKRKTATWLFPYHIVICRQCGFCFTSPSPTTTDLERYHADGLSGNEGIGLPYSIDARLSILKRYSAPTGVFAEIGGSQPVEFHKRCKGLFGTMLNVEVTYDAPADYHSVEEIPNESVDVIAHYDVLEHIPNVKYFLLECHRSLKENGVMVCEVPDVRLYPRNLVLLEFEHVNHFSVSTLALMGQACGLQLIEVGHICSRPYGFASVFRKCQPSVDFGFNMQFEYLDTIACVKGGVEQIQYLLSKIKLLQTSINELSTQGKKITLWGVTEQLRLLLKNYKISENTIIVDSDPRRSNHLENEGLHVFLPIHYIEHIKESKLLAIFAPRYKTEILEWVKRETGKIFDVSDVIVIGTGSAGETLI